MSLRSQQLKSRVPWLDAAAIGASFACLAHCLLLPLLLALVPALSQSLDMPEGFRLGAFLLAVPTSIWAMKAGHHRHRSVFPAVAAAVGLGLLALGALAGLPPAGETVTTVLGSVILALAHLRNWKLQRRAIATRLSL